MLAARRDPIVAIATAPGRGGVGIVRVSAAADSDVVATLLVATKARGTPATGQKTLKNEVLTDFPARQAVYGAWHDARGDVIDQGLTLRFAAPHSYTGEDVLELQAHGGPVVLELLLRRCLEAAGGLGLRLAKPGEFTERAFLNGKLDLAQAEAVADLIDATTEAAAKGASRALSGAFSQEVAALLKALLDLRMLVEATLDFPEEEIDHLTRGRATERLAQVSAAVARALAASRQGQLLKDGIKVVIAGQPNAGKSSLLNALAGAELAIVTPIAGTTRDAIAQSIQIHGVPIHIVDTAGLRETADEVERIGVARAWGHIESADVLLFVHDLTRTQDPAYAAQNQALESAFARIEVRQRINVANKADQAPHTDGAAGIAISAKTGQGIDALREAIAQAAGWRNMPEGGWIARERHVQALIRTQHALAQAQGLLDAGAQSLDLVAEELRLAHHALGEITGQFSADDLLGVIFSSFCIGK
jgi:tRNA modification GTPase